MNIFHKFIYALSFIFIDKSIRDDDFDVADIYIQNHSITSFYKDQKLQIIIL